MILGYKYNIIILLHCSQQQLDFFAYGRTLYLLVNRTVYLGLLLDFSEGLVVVIISSSILGLIGFRVDKWDILEILVPFTTLFFFMLSIILLDMLSIACIILMLVLALTSYTIIFFSVSFRFWTSSWETWILDLSLISTLFPRTTIVGSATVDLFRS